jgi:hypothetical protein
VLRGGSAMHGDVFVRMELDSRASLSLHQATRGCAAPNEGAAPWGRCGGSTSGGVASTPHGCALPVCCRRSLAGTHGRRAVVAVAGAHTHPWTALQLQRCPESEGATQVVPWTWHTNSIKTRRGTDREGFGEKTVVTVATSSA